MNGEHAPLPRDLGPLRSQNTLEPLVVREGKVTTASGSRAYPVHGGLIFMGYAAADEAMIKATMEEERAWQGTPDHVHRDEAFYRRSAPQAVDLINVLRRLTGRQEGLRALELGSGAGWVSWLLTQAGFDTYMCEFEPNSLYSGWLYEDGALGPGKRIVADARYAPFADESFDVVMLKEFVHHVEDKSQLFAEANRILKPGGLIAVMDPTRSVRTLLYELRHPDPHEGHHLGWPDEYLFQLRRLGFRRRWLTVSYFHSPRHRTARRLQERAARNVAGCRHNRSIFTALHMRLLGGGSLVYIGEKVRPASTRPRPVFQQIEPSLLRLKPDERAAWAGCRRVVGEASRRLA